MAGAQNTLVGKRHGSPETDRRGVQRDSSFAERLPSASAQHLELCTSLPTVGSGSLTGSQRTSVATDGDGPQVPENLRVLRVTPEITVAPSHAIAVIALKGKVQQNNNGNTFDTVSEHLCGNQAV